MTIMTHIPRQREREDQGKHPAFPHKVSITKAHHGPHAPERWRAFCVTCHGWWWAPVPDPTYAGWETVLWAAGRHVLYGTWPDHRELEPVEEES